MEIIFTGSRVYGVPRQESDLDIVILCNATEYDMLRSVHVRNDEDGHVLYPEGGGLNLRFGNLNIIATTDEAMFAAWKEGTQFLKDMKYYDGPVTRDKAIAVLERFGVPSFRRPVPEVVQWDEPRGLDWMDHEWHLRHEEIPLDLLQQGNNGNNN